MLPIAAILLHTFATHALEPFNRCGSAPPARVYTGRGHTTDPCLLDVVAVKLVVFVLIGVDVSVLRVVMVLLDVVIPCHAMQGVGWVGRNHEARCVPHEELCV